MKDSFKAGGFLGAARSAGLDAGSVAASATYFAYALRKDSDLSFDVVLSTSPTIGGVKPDNDGRHLKLWASRRGRSTNSLLPRLLSNGQGKNSRNVCRSESHSKRRRQ